MADVCARLDFYGSEAVTETENLGLKHLRAMHRQLVSALVTNDGEMECITDRLDPNGDQQ